jgi:hypothetical protein
LSERHSPVKTVVDLPGSVTFPSPPVPCSQTPPESPAPSPLAEAYWCLPSFRPCRPPDYRVTRLHRFTCVTARTSLGLRLAHVVTSMSPRLDSRWSGSFPLPGREFHPLEAPGLAWRTEEFLQVKINLPAVTRGDILQCLGHRLMSRPSRPKTVGVIGKRPAPPPLQNLHHRLLAGTWRNNWPLTAG